ncbi:hypothetical protein [Rhizobium phaseoli]|uniref:hypothetical protein n=1 Tax=Rhizobium phaseoli TaxID=396 RepID=UPI00143828FA|nr:hypothetical protein [Rhizobium phaseoli]MDK4726403.1 hypothetical protein [Rhizobium phaseoli]NKE89586.1 hypothetical protein [Rhizobium phaseoli]
MVNIQHYRKMMRQAIDRELRASGEAALALETSACRDLAPRTNVVWVNFRRSKKDSQSNKKPPE